jgi:putative tricarboxylic transport membrane protein
MPDTQVKPQDRVVGVLTLLLGAVLYYETYNFRTVDWDWMGLPFWPRLVIAFLMALGAYFAFRGSVDTGPYKTLNPKAFLVLAGAVFYVSLIDVIGYAIMTPLFIGTYSWFLGPKTRRAAIEAVVIAVLGTLIIFYVFKEVLYIQFPEGLLEEQM